jgi:dTDP-4-dehydrorhamnose reductase
MRTLVVGARGQLGRDLVTVFRKIGDVRGVDLPEVDVTDASDVTDVVASTVPDLVVNAAAYTDVEAAEHHREAAFRVNELGARIVAEACDEAGVPVVYYSTDFVFDGSQDRPYEPEDPVHPSGVYAESKAAGEHATSETNPRHFILRTAWLYGPSGNNFVEKILRAAVSKPVLTVVTDEVGSPTHTWDLALATRALRATEAYGTYHAVNAGACSRFEFAQEILRLAGCDTTVEPCSAAEYPANAPRPAYSVLSTEKLTAACGWMMRSWEDALAHYMERRKENP